MYFIFHPIASLNHFGARLFSDQITFFLSIIFFIILSLSYKKDFFQRIDYAAYNLLAGSRVGFLKNHAENFALFGNALFHIMFCLILCLIFLISRHKLSIIMSILFNLIFSWGLNRFMKLIYKRTRPEQLQSSTRQRSSYCFPSGHVMASISIYFFSSMLLQNFIPFLPWYLIALFISVSVIMSRIYLGHHYFTDILGGIFMGIVCLNISLWFYFFTSLM